MFTTKRGVAYLQQFCKDQLGNNAYNVLGFGLVDSDPDREVEPDMIYHDHMWMEIPLWVNW